MKNKLGDLNNHLFAQLERLGDESLDAEALQKEVDRAGAIVNLADKITANADLQLKAAKLFAEHGQGIMPMLPQIGKSDTPEPPK